MEPHTKKIVFWGTYGAYTTILFLILSVAFASASFESSEEFPYFEWVTEFDDGGKIDYESLSVEQEKIIADSSYSAYDDSTGITDYSEIPNNITEYLYFLEIKEKAIDTGLNPNEGIILDYSKEGVRTHCLDVEFDKLLIDAAEISFIFSSESNFDKDKITNTYLKKKVQKENERIESVCTSSFVATLNSSVTTTERSCVNKTLIESYEDWEDLEIRDQYSTDYGFLATYKIDSTGTYRYCFDTPLKDNDNHFGSTGVLYVGYNNQLYYDLQHSSWWNLSYEYKRNITIFAPTGSAALQFYTASVCGLNTANLIDTAKLLPSGNDSALAYNGTQIDYVWANRTWMNATHGNGVDSSNSCIYFRLQANISAGSNDSAYEFYYGAPSATIYDPNFNNPNDVFLAYDDFDRSDSTTIGNGWIEVVGDVNITNGRLIPNSTQPHLCRNFTTTNKIIQEYILYFSSNGVGENHIFLYNSTHLQSSNNIAQWGHTVANTDSMYHQSSGVTQFESSLAVHSSSVFVNFTSRYNSSSGYMSSKVGSVPVVWNVTNTTLTGVQIYNSLCIVPKTVGVDSYDNITWMGYWLPESAHLFGPESLNPLNHAPIQGPVLINATTIFNRTLDNVTWFNTSTSDLDNDTVKSIFQAYLNGTGISSPSPALNLPFESGSNDTYTRDLANYTNSTPYYIDVIGATFTNSGGYDGFGAYTFDGINDAIRINASGNVNVSYKINFSYGGRIFPRSQGVGLRHVLSRGVVSYRFAITQNSSGTGFSQACTVDTINGSTINANTQGTGSPNANLPLNQFYSFFCRYNETRLSLWINGTEFSSVPNQGQIVNNSMASLGNRPNLCVGSSATFLGACSGSHFNGTIDEIFTLPYSASDQEIRSRNENITNYIDFSHLSPAMNVTGCVIPVDRNTTQGNRSCSSLLINSVPVVTSFFINTTNIYNYTNGTVKVNFTAIDAESNPIYNVTTFYIDNVMNKSFDNFTVITQTNFSKGTNITVVYSPQGDGGVFGTNVTGTVIIVNAPPDTFNVSITSDLSTNNTNANLTGNFATNDIDGDTITINATKWYRDGVIVSELSNLTFVNKSFTSRFESWIFSVLSFDGTSYNNWTNSSIFSVLNSIPSTPNRGPYYNVATYDISFPMNCSGSSDVDADTINYEFWVGNITNWAIRQNTTSTVYNHTFEANYSVFFNCRANDAINTSAFNATNITIEFNNSITFGEKSSLLTGVPSGANYTYRFNVSYNGIRVRDLTAYMSMEGVANVTASEANSSDFTNTTVFTVNRYTAFNLSNYNNTIYWYVNSTDWNNSVRQYRFGPYSQSVTGIQVYTTGCALPSNATNWVVANITLRHEENNTKMDFNGSNIDATIVFRESNQPATNNFTNSFGLDNVNQTFICMTAANSSYYLAEAQFRYEGTGKDPRSYYWVNQTLDSTTDNWDFYLLDIALATGIQHTVQNTINDPLKDIYIFVDRYDVATDTYKTVTVGRTDDNGEDYIFLRQNDVEYRYRLQNYTNVIYVSENRKITTTDLFFTIAENSLSEALESLGTIQYALTFDNSSGIFNLVYSNSDAAAIETNCLNVWREGITNATQQICSNCSAQTTDILTCTIADSDRGQFVANFYVETTEDPHKIIKSIDYIRGRAGGLADALGAGGIVLAFLFVGTLGGIAFVTGSPIAAIVLILFGLIMMAITGFLNIGYIALLVIIVGGGVLMARFRE